MARTPADHHLTRPQMLYGDSSPDFFTETSRNSELVEKDEQETKTSNITMPRESRATLVRTTSRRPQTRHPETETPVEVKFQHESPLLVTNGVSREPTPCVADDTYNRNIDNITRLSRQATSVDHRRDNITRLSRQATSLDHRRDNITRLSRQATSTDHGRDNIKRLSRQATSADQGRAPTATLFGSRNQTNPSQKSKQIHRHISRLGSQSRGTIYYHGEILDDNLLISASKLDCTLIRLFSHTREDKENNNKQNPGTMLMPFLNYSQSDLISMDPVMWRVYPMEAAHRETLDQELPYMEVNIKSTEIMKDLYQNDILTHMDYNQLTRTEGQGDRAVTRLMVKTLQRRGDKAFPAFMDALQANDYTSIFERLSQTDRCLRKGMIADASGSETRGDMKIISSRLQRSGQTTPFRTLSIEGANKMLSPPARSVLSANHNSPGSSNVKDLTNQEIQFDHVPFMGLAFPTNQATEFDDRVIFNQQTIDPENLEQQLTEIMADLEALQEDITAMKSEMSPSDRQINSTECEFVHPEHDMETEASLHENRTETCSTEPDHNPKSTSEVTSQLPPPKSGACTVL